MAKTPAPEPELEDRNADDGDFTDYEGERLTVGDLKARYHNVLAEWGTLLNDRENDKPVVPFNKLIPQDHGTLAPTDGATGKTESLKPA